jgi:hypothetical protein
MALVAYFATCGLFVALVGWLVQHPVRSLSAFAVILGFIVAYALSGCAVVREVSRCPIGHPSCFLN